MQCRVNLGEYHHVSRFILPSANFPYYHVFSILFLCTMYCTLHCVLSCTMYCTFHCAPSHCNFHVSLSLLLIALESKRWTIKRFNFVFIKYLSSVSQSNEQAVTAENELKYSLSNIIYSELQNCYFFFVI